MGLNKKSVDDINAKGKRVLVRCDFNVPLKNGEITDDTRIVAALPTIKKLINDGGKVILCSHLGKVKNGPNEGESLAPVAKRLSEKLGKEVTFVADYNVTGEATTKAVENMKEGDVVLLQNTRFRGAEETKNGEKFSKELADLADLYVCDAFGSSHRAHASVAGVTKFITAKGGQNVVGYLMEKEINFLGKAVEDPVRPFVAILGGAKVADKLNVISNLLEKCDTLIIGGGMAYTFLKAKGYEIGKSLVDDTKLDYCKEMIEVQPYAFIDKPVSEEKLEKILKRVFETHLNSDDSYCFSYNKRQYNIPLNQIRFFQSDKRIVQINAVQLDMPELEYLFYGKLEEVERNLRKANVKFLRIRKSLLVNTRFIKEYSADRVVLDNGREVEISKNYRDHVRQHYISMLKGRRWE